LIREHDRVRKKKNCRGRKNMRIRGVEEVKREIRGGS
jgi:hypothetical protein